MAAAHSWSLGVLLKSTFTTSILLLGNCFCLSSQVWKCTRQVTGLLLESHCNNSVNIWAFREAWLKWRGKLVSHPVLKGFFVFVENCSKLHYQTTLVELPVSEKVTKILTRDNSRLTSYTEPDELSVAHTVPVCKSWKADEIVTEGYKKSMRTWPKMLSLRIRNNRSADVDTNSPSCDLTEWMCECASWTQLGKMDQHPLLK